MNKLIIFLPAFVELNELGGPILKPSWSENSLCRAPPARNSSQGRGGSHSPLRVRPMEEGRKSSLSSRPAALPKPFVPSGCASIGIIAAPCPSHSLLSVGPDLRLLWPVWRGA